MAATTSGQGPTQQCTERSIIRAAAGIFVVGIDGAASRMSIRAADYRPHHA